MRPAGSQEDDAASSATSETDRSSEGRSAHSSEQEHELAAVHAQGLAQVAAALERFVEAQAASTLAFTQAMAQGCHDWAMTLMAGLMPLLAGNFAPAQASAPCLPISSWPLLPTRRVLIALQPEQAAGHAAQAATTAQQRPVLIGVLVAGGRTPEEAAAMVDSMLSRLSGPTGSLPAAAVQPPPVQPANGHSGEA